MSKKKSDKKIECFSASFNNILICRHNDAKPFIEVFVSEPENIAQQNLGILAGILEITDESEDSSYIVNYLISVIKKEYYSKPKRGVIESFEAALRKANLALAKLAEHENIAWIGHTNAILLVIDKNNLHLSQSGNASALLLRGKTLTDLSEDPASINPPNPLKTFTDIVSGRLEEDDKLIITTSAMFDIFSLEEIKKSALKFSAAEFIQFLKTALVNELERAAALVIGIKKEEKILNKMAVPTQGDNFNAFSQSAFSKKSSPRTMAKGPLRISSETFSGNAADAEEKSVPGRNSSEREALVNEIKKELAKNNGEFVDKKTGHIYIKGNSSEKETSSDFLEMLGGWQDKLDAYTDSSLKFFGTLRKKNQTAKTLPSPDKEGASVPSFEDRPYSEQAPAEEKNTDRSADRTISFLTIFLRIEKQLLLFWQENYPKCKKSILMALTIIGHTLAAISGIILQKIKAGGLAVHTFWQERQKKKTSRDHADEAAGQAQESPSGTSDDPQGWIGKYSEKLTPIATTNTRIDRRTENRPTKIMPDFSRLKNILAKMDYTQKIYAALAIIFLFIVPYFLAKIGAKPAPKAVSTETAPAPLPLAGDKNVVRVEKITTAYTGENVSAVINLNDSIFAISAKGVVDVANSQNYPFPENFTPTHSAGMDDINFIFFMNQDNRIISWSPASKKFQDNTIEIPSGTRVVSIGTYLTYLYVTDSANGQIYRYPRDTGGFGQKIDWLKGATDLSQIKNMAIGENVYLIDESGLLKFFQGKKQDFTLETAATPIKADALFTKRDNQFLYILDKTNARIVKTDLTGNIVAQYYNADLTKATGFTVDEKNNNAYVSTASGVGIFGMN
ncbi:MAG: hypothetical protein WC022_03495 [Parcubacteria group bacterium]